MSPAHSRIHLRSGRTWALIGLAALLCSVTPTPSASAYHREPLRAQVSSSAAPKTPVFSLRRLPTVLARAAADARLASELDSVLADPALGGARTSSCLSVQGPKDRLVYSRRPDTALIPASTMKVATAAVALAKLGPTTRFATEVRSTGRSADGAVSDLWLVGGGDPLLATGDFALDGGFGGQPRVATSIEALADMVAATGLRRVTGRVIGDESRYDAQRVVPTWNPRYTNEFEVSPISALIVDKGFLTRAPARPVLTTSPPAHAASVFAGLLVARGITVDGGAAEGKTPADATVVTQIESPPMTSVVAEILQNSDNLGAEMLLKELGLRLAGSGSTAAGLGVLKQELAAMAVDLDSVVVTDGSGLDRSDRLTCTALQDLLDRSGEGGDLDNALPVAGRNGTLYRRFAGTPAAGRVRAKTGGLEGVVALAGWVSPPAGDTMQFALLLNDLPRSSPGTAAQDKVVSALATYPNGPPASELGPIAASEVGPVFAPPPAAG